MTPRKLSNASATPSVATSSPVVAAAAVASGGAATAIANPTLNKHIPMIGQANTPANISHLSTIKKNPALLPLSRGVPPPIPPNKPVVPPKREPSATRLGLASTPTSKQDQNIGVGGISATPSLPISTGVAVATSGVVRRGSGTDDSIGGGSSGGCSADDLQDFQQAISNISNK